MRPADENHMLMVKIKCTSCQEVHSKTVGFNKNDETEMSKGRSSANLVMHCQVGGLSSERIHSDVIVLLTSCCRLQFCKKEMSASEYLKGMQVRLEWNS